MTNTATTGKRLKDLNDASPIQATDLFLVGQGANFTEGKATGQQVVDLVSSAQAAAEAALPDAVVLHDGDTWTIVHPDGTQVKLRAAELATYVAGIVTPIAQTAAQQAASASATAAAQSAQAAGVSAGAAATSQSNTAAIQQAAQTNENNSSVNAANAGVSAANALASQNSATASSNSASNSAQAAAAATSAKGVYASTAAGLAATTTGQYFYVVPSVNNGAADLYENVSGAATYMATLASQTTLLSVLNARVQQATYRGWRSVFVDAQGKFAGGINRYGRFILNFGGDVASRLDTYAGNITTLFASVPGTIRGTRLFGVTDKLKTKIAMEVRSNGHLISMGRDLTAAYDATTSRFSGDSTLPRSGYAVAIKDGNGKVGMGVSTTGRPILAGRDLLAEFDALKAGAISNVYISPSVNIITPGDSLTNGAYSQTTWRQQLPTFLTKNANRAITNAAVGGMTSTQIAARLGAYKVLVTFANNVMLASGSTSITATQYISAIDGSLQTVVPLSTQSSTTIRGYLNNVLGTITFNTSNGAMTWLPDANQITTNMNVPTCMPFDSTMFQGHDFDTIVMGLGRNNLSDPTNVQRDLIAIKNWQKTIERRVICITPPNGTGEGVGTTTYNNVVAIEQWAQENFGENAVVSRQILIPYGNSSNTQDAADMAAGIVPTSLRMDTVHWTTAAHGYIAQAVAAIINRKGW